MDKYALIHENIQPVLLGCTKKARKTARMLHSRYGVTSYVCDVQKPLAAISPISYLFLRLDAYPDLNADVLCDTLIRLSESDSSCIWIAIPCDDRFAKLVEKIRPSLENVYIISDTEGISSAHPLLADLKQCKNEEDSKQE